MFYIYKQITSEHTNAHTHARTYAGIECFVTETVISNW